MRRALTLLSGFALMAAGLGVQAGPGPAIGDTRVWARIGPPGSPEGLVVHEGSVYVSTHVSVRGNAGGEASRIFVFDLEGNPTGEIVLEGQDLSVTHGALAMAFDADDNLYVVDRNPGRVVRIDAVTGAQSTYATIPNLPACRPAVGPDSACAPVTVDEPTFADYLAFDRNGFAYVTDLQAATIFRVPPGGGPAAIWYQDPLFDSIFGLNGIAVDPGGTTLYFAMTGSIQPGSPAAGVIYTLPITESPSADDLEVFHTFVEPASGPDGVAFGESGKLYVALAGLSQVAILGVDGTEVARWPDPVANALLDAPGDDAVPYDLPASVAFDGAGSLLVTNQSFFAGNAEHWVVLEAWVDDTALPLIEPDLG